MRLCPSPIQLLRHLHMPIPDCDLACSRLSRVQHLAIQAQRVVQHGDRTEAFVLLGRMEFQLNKAIGEVIG